MLRGILICPDTELAETFIAALGETNQVGIARHLDRYPEGVELMRIILAHAPQVVFISTESPVRLHEIVALLELNVPGLPLAAISRSCEAQLLLDVMRSGIREFISLPFTRESIWQTLARIEDQVLKNPPAIDITDQLYSFLPAKQGSGASTAALNTAVALSRYKDTPTLLIDMDMASGILGFMLKTTPSRTIVDAAENAHHLDEGLWPQLVSRVGELELLLSGGMRPEFRIDSLQIRYLLEFARRHYGAICIDLSGNMERYSVEVMQESKRVFLVITPELPSLHLAREKLRFLNGIDLGDRVSVVLNRNHRRAVVTSGQIENLLGVPVMATLSNDYQGVHRALQAGQAVDPNSELGRQFAALAATILDRKPQERDGSGKKRLVDYLSILPGRYSVAGEPQ